MITLVSSPKQHLPKHMQHSVCTLTWVTKVLTITNVYMVLVQIDLLGGELAVRAT